MAELNAFVGRQAIFDRKNQVVGYELLFRNSLENRARFSDANQATATTMLNAFVELGLDQLAGQVPVWVNLPEDFLLGDYPMPLPPERTVIEVLEDVRVTPALLKQLRTFRSKGFTIALDDFVLTDETKPMIELAQYIKVDVLNVERDEVARQYAALKDLGPKLLAEKISTPEEYAFLKQLGFEMFQGHYLELPIVSQTKRMPHDRAALLQILDKLYAPNVDIRLLEGLIAKEVGLAMRLIKLASSAAMSAGAPIESVRQAVLRLGVNQVAALIVLIMVAGFDDKPLELARQALIRARMAELLAKVDGQPSDQMFTAGLLSLLDAILDRPIAEVLGQLNVGATIRDALVESGGTKAAHIIETVKLQNRGQLHLIVDHEPKAVFVAWYDAVRWADDILRRI